MEGIQRQQKAIYRSLFSSLGKTYEEQAQEYTSFQLQILKSLKLRSIYLQKRFTNEVTTVIKSHTSFLLQYQRILFLQKLIVAAMEYTRSGR
jgi:hypothetical protein